MGEPDIGQMRPDGSDLFSYLANDIPFRRGIGFPAAEQEAVVRRLAEIAHDEAGIVGGLVSGQDAVRLGQRLRCGDKERIGMT